MPRPFRRELLQKKRLNRRDEDIRQMIRKSWYRHYGLMISKGLSNADALRAADQRTRDEYTASLEPLRGKMIPRFMDRLNEYFPGGL